MYIANKQGSGKEKAKQILTRASAELFVHILMLVKPALPSFSSVSAVRRLLFEAILTSSSCSPRYLSYSRAHICALDSLEAFRNKQIKKFIVQHKQTTNIVSSPAITETYARLFRTLLVAQKEN